MGFSVPVTRAPKNGAAVKKAAASSKKPAVKKSAAKKVVAKKATSKSSAPVKNQIDFLPKQNLKHFVLLVKLRNKQS